MWCLVCFGCWGISLVRGRADIGEARFWRLDGQADYGILDGLARNPTNTDLIEANWDDLLRVAGSLKLGTVSASDLMRTLLSW